MSMIRIPNEDVACFADPDCKVRLMRNYGHCAPFEGTNAEGERVILSIAPESILLETHQKNGWIRKNYYDENGFPAGEMFDGKWNVPEKPESMSDAISVIRRLLAGANKNAREAAAGYDEGWYSGEAEAYENVLVILERIKESEIRDA